MGEGETLESECYIYHGDDKRYVMQRYDLEPIVNRVFELIDLEVGGTVMKWRLSAVLLCSKSIDGIQADKA